VGGKERQKATRRVKKLEKELAAGGDVAEQLEDAKVELNYTLYFPDGVKYIALFKDPGDAAGVRKKREDIKRDIKRRMEKGTLGRWTTGDGDGEEEAAVLEEEGEEVEQETKPEKTMAQKPSKQKATAEKAHAEKPKRKKEKEKKDGSKNTKRKTQPEPVGDTIENDDFFEF